uniref:Ribosomal protein L19 n=1 Tax=Araucaria cunninghamii TaxID=56994 RepID=A0A0D6R4A5_ARACU
MALFRNLLLKKPHLGFLNLQSVSTTVISHIHHEKSSELASAFTTIPSYSYMPWKQQLFPAALQKPSTLTSDVFCGGHFSMLRRTVATTTSSEKNPQVDGGSSSSANNVQEVAPRIKFKRPTKTARHIMQILDAEAVQAVKGEREIPDIKPGYIIQLKVEVPENKRRVSVLKGIVIARRNAGLNTTFRIRRVVAGVAVESVFPLYSPNIKEVKVLDKKRVRRAKLYYLREKMGAFGRKK